MSFHWCDNIHTAVFSPRDYQIELLAAAYERNIILCLGHRSSKEFIALKLLQEIGRDIYKSCYKKRGSNISIYLTLNGAETMYTMLNYLTDLNVYQEPKTDTIESSKKLGIPATHKSFDLEEEKVSINESNNIYGTKEESWLETFSATMNEYQVYILKPKTMLKLLRLGKLKINDIQLLLLDDCHHEAMYTDLLGIFQGFLSVSPKPIKILGLAGPLHSAGCALTELSVMLKNLEEKIYCKMETASDIVTVLRYCAKPHEYLVQCAPFVQDELSLILQDIIITRKNFLVDHRYDPFEIYSNDEFLEELKCIPDPKKEPLELLNVMLNILQEMGPWCTDRVALTMYQRIEKQKIKTPHERHYILLCLVNTALLEIHAICEWHFRKYQHNHLQLIENYSSPKVKRLLEILRLFKPSDTINRNETMRRINMDLEQLDFNKLTRILETKWQTVDQIVEKQKLQSRSIVENLDNVVKVDIPCKTEPSLIEENEIEKEHQQNVMPKNSNNINQNFSNNSSGRSHTNRTRHRRVFNRRSNPNQYNQQNHHDHYYHNRDTYDSNDYLCSIIFCNSNYTARVLFDLLCEMSRYDSQLKYLKCQYTTDRIADPVTEPKEAELEHRRQEEVLKRFRIHDCNVLIGTSILEEGIDVPKCNLVIRWDPPSTYRSYVQCKGRARAIPAYHIILVAPKLQLLNDLTMKANLNNGEQLNDDSHRLICRLQEGENDEYTDSSSSESSPESMSLSATSSISNNSVDYRLNNPEHRKKSKMKEEKYVLTNINTNTNTNLSSNANITKQGSYTYESGKGTVKILNPEVITNKPPISKPTTKTENTISNLILKEIKDDNLKIHYDNEKDSNYQANLLEDIKMAKKRMVVEKNEETENIQVALKTNNHLTPQSNNNIIGENTFHLTLVSKNDAYNEYDLQSSIEKLTQTHCLNEKQHLKHQINIVNGDLKHKLKNDNLINQLCDKENENKKTNQKVKKKKVFYCSLNKTYDKKTLTEKSENDSAKLLINSQKNDIQYKRFQVMNSSTDEIIRQMAHYEEIEKMLLMNCANKEPLSGDHIAADKFNNCVAAYKPVVEMLTGAFVDLSNSIALVNKYCAKLPSDTFTKLTPIWRCCRTMRENYLLYQYTIRLPINSPLKYDIIGLPMPNQILARRMAALQTCIELHKNGELDDNLQPIGKENFKAIDSDWENFELEEQDEKIIQDNSEPRPGTTKRRQYYYKRIAEEICDCRPVAGVPCYLYLLDLTLQCPIPEEQNTRGRKIYPPEDAKQGFGILTLKKIPKVSSFPIFTRSGEVKVTLVLHPERVILNQMQINSINTFINYTFTKVLRLKKFLMLFDPESTENCVFIVPTIKTDGKTYDNTNSCCTKNDYNKTIDWSFLKVIEESHNMMPVPIPEEERHAKEFDAERFKDAVVMPWYRNQDQPHYFYVAEICHQLTPLSIFPSEKYCTFKHYYKLKYGLNIHTEQPLLDVDHTSARLNFLTPRYVNRKGVALPTSSEATKRAKRENLELKQILVPELCTIHPFPASLWRTAVCLPCILYRINGLLLADDIRKQVVRDIGLGKIELPENQSWPILHFGWSLSDVLGKSKYINNPTGSLDNDIAGKKLLNGKRQNESIDNNEVNKICPAQNNGNGKLERTLNEIIEDGELKLHNENKSLIEIGTWCNEMANDIQRTGNETDDSFGDGYYNYEEDNFEFYDGLIPKSIKFCKGNKTIRAISPTFTDVNLEEDDEYNSDGENEYKGTKHWRQLHKRKMSKHSNSLNQRFMNNKKGIMSVSGNNVINSYDADNVGCSEDEYNSYDSYDDFDDDDDDESYYNENDIEFTSKNEAENIETAEDIEKFNKQLSIIQKTKENERIYQETKNQQTGYDFQTLRETLSHEFSEAQTNFNKSIESFMEYIKTSGILVEHNKPIKLLDKFKVNSNSIINRNSFSMTKECQFRLPLLLETAKEEQYQALMPYINLDKIKQHLQESDDTVKRLKIDTIRKLNNEWIKKNLNLPEVYVVDGSGDLFDHFNDPIETWKDEKGNKLIQIDYQKQGYQYHHHRNAHSPRRFVNINKANNTDYQLDNKSNKKEIQSSLNEFSFDYQPDLNTHYGPSPSIILQALTMSNANDGINLERLETIGDSFLKYAITTYLYITYENVHEGKLSHLRSKQVANLNLYRLGRRKKLGEYMIATKFEPSDNWLPPCYYVPKELEKALIEAKIPPHYWSLVDLALIKRLSNTEICELVRKKADEWGLTFKNKNNSDEDHNDEREEKFSKTLEIDRKFPHLHDWIGEDEKNTSPAEFSCFIPYNLVSQHSIPDKSVADCVEALIGAYLIECGLRGALLFTAWLGIRVLPIKRIPYDPSKPRVPGSTLPDADGMVTVYGSWSPPRSPLLRYTPNAEWALESLLTGYEEFEKILNYKFYDRSYLLQAMTHASYTPNRLTDCYQRLEFLGDAVLDYLITRHLYEDPRQHSPGALTDLRSALVNNTIFASLAVRHGFHKYFRHLSPGLNEVIDRFVRIQTENGHCISEEYLLSTEEECDDAEDIEVPKALGDVFESVAGAIFLDSNMSLDEVWRVYSNMMRPEIEQFSNSVPKSPIRELLELEPETAKFGKPEKLADGRRVRVTVEVFCKGTYRGIGRNYRIAKCTAAKCALRQLRKKGLIGKSVPSS